MVIGILVVGAILAFIVQFIPSGTSDDPETQLTKALIQGATDDAPDLFARMLLDPASTFEDSLDALVLLAHPPWQPLLLDDFDAETIVMVVVDENRVAKVLQNSKLDNAKRQIALALWSSLNAGEPAKELIESTKHEPIPRYVNHALGLYWSATGESDKAIDAFTREGQLPEAAEARRRLVELYDDANDMEGLRKLSVDSDYAKLIPHYVRMKIAASDGDWNALWWLIPKKEWAQITIGPTGLALFAGICWWLFTLHAGQVDASFGARAWPCLAAVVLGILSIWPTNWLILWQGVNWDMLESSGSLVGGIRYFVLGVGLREELSKLLLFLPLTPFLYRRRHELEVLMVAGCVGLGFAILENVHYFTAAAGSGTIGRFLTANFFHMAATGLVGLAVMRAIWAPRTHIPEAVLVFGLIVFAHGLYDAAIIVPALAQYNIVGSIIYILLAYQFFRELRSMRTSRLETISLTATFLCGVSLLSAVTFVYASAYVGWAPAAQLMMTEILSTALMAYMFLREMPNSLVTV